MKNFNLIDIFTQVSSDLFSYIGINHKLMCEVSESTLSSTEDIITIIGVAGDISGNIMFGFTEKTAKEIAAKILGVDKINTLDSYAKAALVDFYSEFAKRAINTIKIENLFNVNDNVKDYSMLTTPPIYIRGENMQGIISQISSKKVFFKIHGEKFGIAYSLEQKRKK